MIGSKESFLRIAELWVMDFVKDRICHDEMELGLAMSVMFYEEGI